MPYTIDLLTYTQKKIFQALKLTSNIRRAYTQNATYTLLHRYLYMVNLCSFPMAIYSNVCYLFTTTTKYKKTNIARVHASKLILSNSHVHSL